MSILYLGILFWVLYLMSDTAEWLRGYTLMIMCMYYGSMITEFEVYGPYLLPALGMCVIAIYNKPQNHVYGVLGGLVSFLYGVSL